MAGLGNGFALAGGVVAAFAFFKLPYVDLGAQGSFVGPQVATALNLMASGALLSPAFVGSITQGPAAGFNLSLLLWAEALCALMVGGIALWQMVRQLRNGAPISRRAMLVVLGAAVASLLILLYQCFGLQSSTAGALMASYLGTGYWTMVTAMGVTTIGAFAQLWA